MKMSHIENSGYVQKDPDVDGQFKWTVFNFFSNCESDMNSTILSPWFPFENNKWCFVLSPNRVKIDRWTEPDDTYIGVFLWGKCSKPLKDNFSFHICLVKEAPKDPRYKANMLERHSLDYSSVVKSGKSNGTWHFLPITLFSKYSHYLSPNGIMSFDCTITKLKSKNEDDDDSDDDDDDDSDSDDDGGDGNDDEGDLEADVDDNEEREGQKDDEEKEHIRLHLLQQDFEKMFLDGQNADMTIKVENIDIPVHKCILGVRSPVFSSMLLHDMKEKNSNIVDIPDCSADAFKVFLLYLYTGSTNKISAENVFNLYYIADKYHVEGLKKNCVTFIKNILSVNTFCDVISLSLRHKEIGLQKAATSFFCKNVKKIIKTVKWQEYIQNYPIQANELYIKALDA